MDFLQKRIREKLIQRGNSERQRAEEWERSLKPTTYLGKNLYQELGGTPIEGRYLGQQGLIPGQSVPNIGRNPNKPVIPGLPQIVIPEPEEGGVIQQIIPTYSAIFTREVAGGRTQWTDLEMLQRDPSTNFNQNNDWKFTDPLLAGINSLTNDRIFYYWNGASVNELFRHQSSELVSNGSISHDGSTVTIYSFSTPGNLENGMLRLDASINFYDVAYYYIILQIDSGSPPFNLIWKTSNDDVLFSGNFGTVILNGGEYRIAFIGYGQDTIDNNPGSWQFDVSFFAPGSFSFEVYRIYSHGAYFTTTEEGVAFAHVTNGNAGDGKIRFRYFSGEGKQPVSLNRTHISQNNIDDPFYAVPYATFDWRSSWLTSTSSLVNNISQAQFYGVDDNAIQYSKLSASGGNGYDYAIPFFDSPVSEVIKYIFNGEGSQGLFSSSSTRTATFFNSVTGEVLSSSGISVDLTWPRVDLSSFGVEGVNWFIEDICTPDYWTSNRVAFYDYWLPMIAIYPYHKKIFF